jgi:cytochrome P450
VWFAWLFQAYPRTAARTAALARPLVEAVMPGNLAALGQSGTCRWGHTMNLDEINLLDHELQNCPYDAYATLRNDAPVWRDPITGMYVISRYDDVRNVLLDTDRFGSGRSASGRGPGGTERAMKIKRLYEQKGWLPAPTLAGRDEPEHRQMRALFDHAFRPSKIKAMDPFIAALADRLVDDFIDDGRCDWVRQFAVPLPLIVIGKQMGAPEADIWRIKAWTDAWVQRLGMMQTEEQAIWSTEMEIEAQHYFQTVFDRLRAQPDDTLLSDLVNTVIPEWGRPLNDNELHAEMMADTFVGGSETSTNALAFGVMLLIQNPDVWARLKAGSERDLAVFVEEVIRLEGPVQGLFRTARVDVELHGVTIPAGSIINIRYAAANRDQRHFDCPADVDLDRHSAKSHLGFGVGMHYCLGAPLARRELMIGFGTALRRFESMSFAQDPPDLTVAPNFCLRALQQLQIEFTPAG